MAVPLGVLIIPPTLDFLTRNDVSFLPTAKNSGTIPTFSVSTLHCIISSQEVKGMASVPQPAPNLGTIPVSTPGRLECQAFLQNLCWQIQP